MTGLAAVPFLHLPQGGGNQIWDFDLLTLGKTGKCDVPRLNKCTTGCDTRVFYQGKKADK